VQIGIIGAGAVGGVIAALLDRAGHGVEITARGAHLDALQSHGLELTGAWGTHRTGPPNDASLVASSRLTRPADLVIVTTKAHDAAAAIAENSARISSTPLLVIQNGLGGLRTATALCPTSPIVGGLALFAASYVSEGRVAVTAGATTYLGGEAAAHAGTATSLADRVLGEVMPLRILDGDDAFTNAAWTKLIINQINSLPAITGLSAQEVIANRELRLLMTAGMREAVRIGLRSGVHFGSLQGLTHTVLTVFSALPLALGQRLPLEIGKQMGTTPNPGSTLQSLRRGQLTEIDYLNGAVIEAAHAAGLRAPINSLLVDLVHEVENSGVFMNPTEVAARMAVAE